MAVKRGRNKEMSEENKALLAAVQKVTSIQKGTNLTDRQSHCRFFNGYVVATNDIVIYGVPVTGLSVECCPHSKTLVAALERCQGEITFVLEGSVLTVKSGKIRVPVPCLDGSTLADLQPDGRQGDASPALAKALGQAAGLVLETASNLMCRAVFMGPGTVEAIHDAKAAIQIWHGVSPLPNIAMPKDSAVAISKNDSPLVALGLSNGTATFWFEDNSYLRTCLYDVKGPDFDKLFECKVMDEPKKLESEFFEAIKTMMPFSKVTLDEASTEAVCFEDGKVWAGRHAHSDVASIDYQDSPVTDGVFNGNYILMFEKFAQTVVHDQYNCKLYFAGESIRGVLMGMRAN